MSPDVSVVLPAFNAEATVAVAIASVQRQRGLRWELVLVDDGSEDATASLGARLAAADPRIRLLRHPHRGVVAALNAGLDAARGEWIARLDADDAMHPRRLRAQLDFMLALPCRERTLLGTRVRFFPHHRRARGTLRYERWVNGPLSPEDHERALLIDAPIPHPTFFAHRGLFEGAGGYREGPFPEDYDLILRLQERGVELRKLPEVLTFWRDHDDRLTRTDPRCSPPALRRLKAAFIARRIRAGALAEGRPLWIWGAGQAGRRFMAALEHHAIRVHAAVDVDPKKIGHRIRAGRVPVVAMEALKTAAPRPYVLAAVAAEGARPQIRRALIAMGYEELRDFRMVQ